MRARKYSTLTALAICVLALAALGSAKNPVPRPFKISGHLEGAVTGVNWPVVYFAGTDVGEATHTGPYVNPTTWAENQITGELTGGGVLTAANGDTIEWTMGGGPAENQFTVTFHGGTGRFAKATGGCVMTMFNVVPTPTSVSFDHTGEGSITY